MEFPKISTPLSHLTSVSFGRVTVWISYQTPIAFKVDGWIMVVHKNVWSKTTGRHLNYINEDYSTRVDGDTFLKKWKEQTKGVK